MKAIILAAEQGIRLAPLTNLVPKTMVTLWDRTLIGRIIDTLHQSGIRDVSVVGGYKEDILRLHIGSRVKHFYSNPRYSNTNLVESLFCALPGLERNEDVIISSGDIIYQEHIVEQLLASTAPVSVVVDLDWERLWRARMKAPLSDAESLCMKPNGLISSLGKKAYSMVDIQGQYIGLIKVSKAFLPQFIQHYCSMDRDAIYDGTIFEQMHMTSFIQSLIYRFNNVRAVTIEGGWLAVNSISDLEVYEKQGQQFLDVNVSLPS